MRRLSRIGLPASIAHCVSFMIERRMGGFNIARNSVLNFWLLVVICSRSLAIATSEISGRSAILHSRVLVARYYNNQCYYNFLRWSYRTEAI